MPRTFDVLNTNGGHILVGLLLLGIGAAFCKCGVPKGEDIIVGAMTLLGRSMMDQSVTRAKQDEEDKGGKDGLQP